MLSNSTRRRFVRLPTLLRWLKAAVIALGLIMFGALGYAAGYMVTAASSFAQDATNAASSGNASSASEPSQSKLVEKPTKHPARLRKPRSQAAIPSALPAAAHLTNFAARLQQAGATTCAPRIDELAAASMQGTTATANASSWFVAAPNERAVNIVIAQKFAAANVPYGATDIFASPLPNAKCDALALQVIPSPLPCERLRQEIAARGKIIADLVGLPLLQDSNGQVMLIPTRANACVIVGLRIAYAR